MTSSSTGIDPSHCGHRPSSVLSADIIQASLPYTAFRLHSYKTRSDTRQTRGDPPSHNTANRRIRFRDLLVDTTQNHDMDSETAVITGASRGIGKAVATALADSGTHVFVCARDGDEIEETATEIRDAGGTVTASRADVRDEYDVERLMERAAEAGGAVDYVVANAGVYHGPAGETPLSTASYAAFDDHLRTNARGVFTTLREALPHLADDARLLVTSGVVARESYPGYGSYAVSKAAAEAIARGFAADTAYDVCVVDPGQVSTNLTGGDGHAPEAVADQFRWAAEDAPAELLDGGVIDRKTWRRQDS